MKILVVCQYYFPEPFRIADTCEWLAERGHEVHVITGVPNYPMGKVYPGYARGAHCDETVNGVRIHRCFTVARRSGAVFRLLNYFSFALSSSRYAARLKEDYDVVFVNQLSPVMMASAARKYKKKHRKKMVLYCQDLWPESLTVGGVRRGSLLYRLFHRISRKLYCSADKLLLTSSSFAEYFRREFGITEAEHLPQYAEELFAPDSCQKEPNGLFDVMFAGNIGIAQSVETIVRAAAELKNDADIRFHIVGDGVELERIKELSEELGVTSIVFHGRQAVADMPRYYAMADAMLVTMQKDPVLSMTLPGKVQTYLAAGKPILGAIDGEAARVIADADVGVSVPAEDHRALADAVRQLAKAPDTCKRYGENAKAYYSRKYEKEAVLTRLEEILLENSDD